MVCSLPRTMTGPLTVLWLGDGFAMASVNSTLRESNMTMWNPTLVDVYIAI